jgi:hypothetical protein
MLLNFTDATTGNPIAINPQHLVVLFSAKDDTGKEKTVLNMLNGNVAINEDFISAYGQLQGELK